MKKFRPRSFIVAIALAFLFLLYWWAHLFSIPACTAGDCLSYIELMGKPLFTGEYWNAWKSMYRAYTVPFLFSLFGPLNEISANRIGTLQIILSFASWITLAWSISGLTSRRILRYLLFISLALLMFDRGYYFSNRWLWSDSLALSLLLFWFSYVLRMDRVADFIQSKSWFTKAAMLASFAVLTSLTSNARDANAVLLLTATVPVWFILAPRSRLYASVFTVIIVAVCFVHLRGSRDRSKLSISTTLIARVLNDPSRTDYFVQRGLPITAEIKDWQKTIAPLNKQWCQEIVEAVPFPWNPTLQEFAKKKAMGIYVKYLISHPKHTLAMVFGNWDLIMGQREVFPISPPPAPFHRLSLIDLLPTTALFLCTILAALSLWSIGEIKGRLPLWGLFFCTTGTLNAVMAFLVDSWAMNEARRHAFIGSVFFRIGACILIALAVTKIIDRIAVAWRGNE